MEGVTSDLIAGYMHGNKHVFTKEEMLAWMKQNKPALVVTSGAGDIDTLVKPVKEILETA